MMASPRYDPNAATQFSKSRSNAPRARSSSMWRSGHATRSREVGERPAHRQDPLGIRLEGAVVNHFSLP
jgi:hypothetical protein